MKTVYLGVLRHLLTIAAGALASKGIIDAAAAETLIGAVLAVVGVAWSVYEKRRRPVVSAQEVVGNLPAGGPPR